MAKFDPDAYLSGSEPEKKKPVSEFDPDAYLKEPAPVEQTSAATQFGRSAASLADTALNTITGTLDYAAYPLALAYYGATGNRSLAEASRLAQQETTSPKDVVGRAFGVAGTPEYENAPLRAAGTAIGQGLNEYAIKPVVEATGLPEEYVGNIVNTALMGAAPAAGRVAAPVVRGAGKVVGAVDDAVVSSANALGTTAKGVGVIVKHPIETAKGIAEGFTGRAAAPESYTKGLPAERAPWETAPTRMKAEETFIPGDVLDQLRAGIITPEIAEQSRKPITDLPLDALKVTGGVVPYEGQVNRAIGQHIGESYRNPYALGAELAADYFLGGLPTAARLAHKVYKAGQLADAYNQLNQAGFKPLKQGELNTSGGNSGGIPPVGPVPVSGAPVAPIAPAGGAAAPVVQPTVQPVTPMLGYDPTVQPVRSFSERPQAPQPFYADQQGNVSGARPLAGSEAGYQERLTAAQQIQAATDEALAKQRAKVDADMAAMEASRIQAEQLRAADLARKQAEAEAQNEAIRQQIEAKRAADRAEISPVAPVETPAPVAETPAPIAQGPVKPVEIPTETGAESLFDWGETAPKAEPKKRDVSVKNARAQAYKDFEDILKGDSTASATDILKEFEKELSLRQMRVYNAAYDAAILEGKDASQAARAGNQALRQAKLPPLAGDRATTRMKPKDSTILEQKLAQQWYDGLDAGTKADIDTLMQATGKDLHQTFVDFSSKPTRKSLFDEPVETPKSAPKSNPNEMGMMTDKSGPTFANLDEFNQEFFANTLSGKETVGIVADRNAVVTKKRGEYGDNIDIKGLLDDGTEVYITQDPIGGFNPIIGLTDSKPTDLSTSYTVKRGGHSINQVYKNGTLEYERVTYPNGDADTWYASTGGERSYGRDLRKQAPIAKMAQDLIK